MFVYAVERLVSYAQDTHFPATNYQIDQIRTYITSIMSASRFSHVYGAQSRFVLIDFEAALIGLADIRRRTFHKADLALLRNPYAVCLKTDGIRVSC